MGRSKPKKVTTTNILNKVCKVGRYTLIACAYDGWLTDGKFALRFEGTKAEKLVLKRLAKEEAAGRCDKTLRKVDVWRCVPGERTRVVSVEMYSAPESMDEYEFEREHLYLLTDEHGTEAIFHGELLDYLWSLHPAASLQISGSNGPVVGVSGDDEVKFLLAPIGIEVRSSLTNKTEKASV